MHNSPLCPSSTGAKPKYKAGFKGKANIYLVVKGKKKQL